MKESRIVTLLIALTCIVGLVIPVWATYPTGNNPIIPDTIKLRLPSGTTAQRPGSPVNGDTRYNSTTSKFEGYENGAWKNIITSATATGVAQFTIATKTASFTASDGAGYYYRMTTNDQTVTLPASPADGSIRKFKMVTAGKVATFAFDGAETFNHADGTSDQSLTLEYDGGVIEMTATASGWDET